MACITPVLNPTLTDLVNRNRTMFNQPVSCVPIIIPPINNFTSVTWITDITLPTTIPFGGTPLPVSTNIPRSISILPPNTVSIINGYCRSTTRLGAISLENGFFTVPLSGNYIISGNVTFASVASTLSSDLRELYLYTVDNETGNVLLMAVSTEVPVAGNQTSLNVSTSFYLNDRDRVFMGVRQLNSLGQVLSIVPRTGRFTLTLLK